MNRRLVVVGVLIVAPFLSACNSWADQASYDHAMSCWSASMIGGAVTSMFPGEPTSIEADIKRWREEAMAAGAAIRKTANEVKGDM